MGADAGVHVVDDSLHGSDAIATSLVLAKALGTLTWDLVILGTESTDARMSVVPAMLAERLGVAQLTFAGKVDVDGTTVRIQRVTDTGYDTVEAVLPAVVSVVEKINEPRYPSFKGIMAAKKKPVTTLTLADLGIGADEVGLAGAWSAVTEFAAPPAAAGRHDRQGRGRRRRQARRVPRRRQVRLVGRNRRTWLRSSSSSTTSTVRSRRSRPSC